MIDSISHYKLIRPIASGGMGEVYLAEDTTLGRKVALKVLPGDVTGDRKRLNRFLQEARLAANLNHPNICTIYEIDAAAEPPFLAMELVQGETLSDRIDTGTLTIGEILAITTQIADALDEAHRAGVIHRDIKSSNVIINHRGQVKILDFGLAKNIAEEVTEEEVTRAKTEEGMLVGTVQYMSPEHALGKKLDGRTDLWSLGVLLYEMLAGDLPFRAATQAGTFDAILNREPAPIERETPVELDAVLGKLLEKDRELRYQNASDLVVDLRRLRRTLGEPTESFDSIRVSTSELGQATGTVRRRTDEVSKARVNRWRFALPIMVFLLAVAGAVGFGLWKFRRQTASAQPVSQTRQTNLGKVVDAAISPAGDHIVYVTDDGSKQTLWMKQASGGTALQIVPPSGNVYQGLAVSADNKWVYFNVWDRVSVGEIFRIPLLGGTPQRIVHDCMPGVSVSPDGSRLVFIRSDDKNKRFAILTAGSEGSGETEVHSLPGTFAYQAIFGPDGRTIAFGMFETNRERFPQIVEIPAEGGPVKQIWSDKTNRFQPGRFAWVPDRSAMIVTLANSRELETQIWRIEYPSGQMRPITKDQNSYGAISLSSNGMQLLAVQQDFLLSVWNVPADKPNEARRITDGKTEGLGLDWMTDGRVVFTSTVGGVAEVWTMNDDGSDKRQLTTDGIPKLSPCASGDGRYVFFGTVGTERGGAGRIETSGRGQQQLENKWNVLCSSLSDKILYFAPGENDRAALFRDTSTFSAPQRLEEKTIVNASLSPDGDRLGYVYWDEQNRRHGFEVMNLNDGSAKPFELPPTAVQRTSETQFVLRWTPDGKAISFANDENGFANIWLLPLDGGKPKRVTTFNDNFIFSFAWSHDGRKLVVARGTFTADAVLFKF